VTARRANLGSRPGFRSAAGTTRTVLEVRLVPRAATEGFLNSYTWIIPLSPDEIRQLTATMSGTLHRQRRIGACIRRLVAAYVRRHGMPVFGELADYSVDFDHAFLRISLNPR